ncbi:MAG: Kae1-associated serine/threonine protein kinase [Candidatus Woesearchaeota archaeon]|nr:MAG: Kae1-associated serine/threonine protein kinase [Candidatus Woesearchaeota archaeon]
MSNDAYKQKQLLSLPEDVSSWQEIGRGAEAVVVRKGDLVCKTRIPKTYRAKELDNALRTKRTRKEAKILFELTVPSPELVAFTEDAILMTYVSGKKLSDVFSAKHIPIVAKLIFDLHQRDVVHGDLTTANMIEQPTDAIALIDFGLAQHNARIEDKAVDIHLFFQSVKSNHHSLYAVLREQFFTFYVDSAVQERLRVVESRGRNKGK